MSAALNRRRAAGITSTRGRLEGAVPPTCHEVPHPVNVGNAYGTRLGQRGQSARASKAAAFARLGGCDPCLCVRLVSRAAMTGSSAAAGKRLLRSRWIARVCRTELGFLAGGLGGGVLLIPQLSEMTITHRA
ncbi:MAG: hypothetical protein M1118_15075 [Chloroflexi bacterium]|nr:hypothetical protein [Chloroflexota bacterium]